MALTSAFSNVITLVIFLKTKWTPLTRDYLLSKPWTTLLWVALFSLGTIIPLEFIYEQIGIEMAEAFWRLLLRRLCSVEPFSAPCWVL